MKRRRTPGLRLFTALSVAIATRSAHAEREGVYLIGPEPDDATAVQLAHLTRGELAADRVPVTVLDDDDGRGPQPRAALERLGGGTRTGLTVVLRIEHGSHGIDLWLSDGANGREVHRRLEPRGEWPAGARLALLARQAADGVRALLWEGLLERMGADPAGVQPARAEKPVAPTPAAGERHEPWLAVELGVAAFGNFDGLGMAFDPMLRVRVEIAPWLRLRAGVAAFGSRAGLGDAARGANVGQSIALVEALAPLGSGRPIYPFVSVGAGLFDVRVDGSAAAPEVARQADLVGFAIDAGLGVAFRATDRFEVTAEAHALFSEPVPRVRTGGPNDVVLGLPTAVATIALASRL